MTAKKEVGAPEIVAEKGSGGGGWGSTCPLRSRSHVLCRWGGRAKWDRGKMTNHTKLSKKTLYYVCI